MDEGILMFEGEAVLDRNLNVKIRSKAGGLEEKADMKALQWADISQYVSDRREVLEEERRGHYIQYGAIRALDVGLSAAAIAGVALPVLAVGVVSAVTEKTSEVLFRQDRFVGGKKVQVTKFKTYKDGTEDRWKSGECETRLEHTKIGKFLRNSCLDEVWNFVDVFLGKYSMVGPRPLTDNEITNRVNALSDEHSPEDAVKISDYGGIFADSQLRYHHREIGQKERAMEDYDFAQRMHDAPLKTYAKTIGKAAYRLPLKIASSVIERVGEKIS